MSNVENTLGSTIQELGLQQQQSTTAKKRNELGQQEFLDLMVAQLRNQDPFAPLENGEFIAQMAQFSQVTGLEKLQTSFDQLATSLQSNQALQASTMVGRTVLVPSSQGMLSQNGTLNGVMDLDQSSSNVVLNISNASGELIRSISMGIQGAGAIPFSWDGLSSSGARMPPGRYNVNATAQTSKGASELSTLVNASVESVTLNQNTRDITLNLKDMGPIAFNQVREIK